MCVPAVAVGLSAVSFSAALQKDAASIPNALGAARTQAPPYILINKVYFGFWLLAIDCWLLAIEPAPSVTILGIRGGKKRFVLISADSWTQKISVQIREI